MGLAHAVQTGGGGGAAAPAEAVGAFTGVANTGQQVRGVRTCGVLLAGLAGRRGHSAAGARRRCFATIGASPRTRTRHASLASGSLPRRAPPPPLPAGFSAARADQHVASLRALGVLLLLRFPQVLNLLSRLEELTPQLRHVASSAHINGLQLLQRLPPGVAGSVVGTGSASQLWRSSPWAMGPAAAGGGGGDAGRNLRLRTSMAGARMEQ